MNPEEVNEARENFFWRIRVGEKFEAEDSGDIKYKSKRFNLMGADYFMSEIIESLSDLYAGAAGGIIRETGQEYGRELLETVEDGEGDTRFGNFLAFLQFVGYSTMEAEKGEVHVKSSPTAEEHLKAGHDEKKVCFFLSGILAGAYRDIYDEEIEFVETECRAEGAEECVFEKKQQTTNEKEE